MASMKSIPTTATTTTTTTIAITTTIAAAIATNELPAFTRCKTGVRTPEKEAQEKGATAIPGPEQSIFFLL